MSRWLFPNSTFTAVAKEPPAIPNLRFAAFFGDRSINSKDNTNLVLGAPPLVQVGTPQLSRNYATTLDQGLGGWSTSMVDDNTVNLFPCTLVVATVPPPNTAGNQFPTVMQFAEPGNSHQIFTWLWSGSTVALNTGIGGISGGSGSAAIPAVANDSSTWGLYAFVSVVGKQVVGYNLTTNQVVTVAGGNVTPALRPVAGTWGIGAWTTTSYHSNNRVAFALGANTEMNQAALLSLRDALRFPLGARGIIV